MDKIKVLEWNLHFASDNNTEIAPFVKEYINNFDILIFTEVVYNDSLKKMIEGMGEYETFVSFDHGENQVVIAAKTNLQPRLMFDKLPDIPFADSPDFIQIEINSEGEKYRVIGCRIRIANGSLEDYKERKNQFQNLVDHISKFSDVILLGDMNNGIIKGNSEADYEEVMHLYEKTSKGESSAQKYFNFHLMKEILGDNFVLKEIGGETSSWGMSKDYLWGKIKNDQLIISDNIIVDEKYYNWDFVRENKYIYEDMFIVNKGKNWISHGYPDHAILIAEIKIKKSKQEKNTEDQT